MVNNRSGGKGTSMEIESDTRCVLKIQRGHMAFDHEEASGRTMFGGSVRIWTFTIWLPARHSIGSLRIRVCGLRIEVPRNLQGHYCAVSVVSCTEIECNFKLPQSSLAGTRNKGVNHILVGFSPLRCCSAWR